MKTVKIDRHRVSRRALFDAVSVLRAGGAVVFPTETAYGLAVDSGNAEAVAEIFRIKGRGREKSLPLIASSFVQAEKCCIFRGKLRSLAKRHWPDALTLVVKPKRKFAAGVASHDGTVAVRVPGLAWPRRLAEELGRPITSTSANRSGRPTIYRAKDILREFRRLPASRRPDLFLDAGDLPRRPPSTIVRLRRGRLEILRQGEIKVN